MTARSMLMRAIAVALCLSAANAGVAAAQSSAPSLRAGQVVVGMGGGWMGRDTLGEASAETRRSALGTLTPPTATLFDTSSEIGSAGMIDLTVAVAATPSWGLEVRGSRGRPALATTITNDPEASGTFTATERVAEYTVDASVVYHPGWAGLGRRARAYVLAGGGYLRQLHDDNALVVTGKTFHGGAGVRWWVLGGRGGRPAAGLVGEARWVVRQDGITLTDERRGVPMLAVRAFVGF